MVNDSRVIPDADVAYGYAESAWGAREAEGAFPGVLALLDLAGVSRETFGTYWLLSGLMARHSSRHSLNPIVMSPSPAASKMARCSSVSGLRNQSVSVRHGLGIH